MLDDEDERRYAGKVPVKNLPFGIHGRAVQTSPPLGESCIGRAAILRKRPLIEAEQQQDEVSPVSDVADSKAADGHDDTGAYIGVIADIVSAYVSNNSLRPSDLPDLIASVHMSIQMISKGEAEVPVAAPLVPAVPVKKSVTKDFLICLEDGKKFRSLKRHLGSVYSMTPDEYRQKWGLPSDYPMVAPGYSEVRSQLAKEIGLGQQRSAPAAAASAAPTTEATPAPVRGKRAAAG